MENIIHFDRNENRRILIVHNYRWFFVFIKRNEAIETAPLFRIEKKRNSDNYKSSYPIRATQYVRPYT